MDEKLHGIKRKIIDLLVAEDLSVGEVFDVLENVSREACFVKGCLWLLDDAEINVSRFNEVYEEYMRKGLRNDD